MTRVGSKLGLDLSRDYDDSQRPMDPALAAYNTVVVYPGAEHWCNIAL